MTHLGHLAVVLESDEDEAQSKAQHEGSHTGVGLLEHLPPELVPVPEKDTRQNVFPVSPFSPGCLLAVVSLNVLGCRLAC